MTENSEPHRDSERISQPTSCNIPVESGRMAVAGADRDDHPQVAPIPGSIYADFKGMPPPIRVGFIRGGVDGGHVGT